MKGRLKGAWILSLLLAGLFQPSLGQGQQEILTGLQLSHQPEEPNSCSYAPNSQPTPDRAKVDCYDSVKGSAHDYGALSLTGEYIAFRNYVGKYILFVNVATY